MILDQYVSVYLMPVNALSLAISAQYTQRGSAPHTRITILDNNKQCHGNTFRGGVCVLSPELHKIPADATVIVCSFLSKKAITHQLREFGIHNILNYEDVLSESDYDTLIEAFKIITVDELRAISPQHVNLFEVGAQKIKNAWYAAQLKIVINDVNLVPTLRCDLKCGDCSAFIPYFEDQYDFDAADVCRGIRLLSELVDNVIMCTILGGEPFLHKDIGAIATCASSLDNIVSVSINTNGTVLPTQDTCEQLSKLNHFNIAISDYGELSRQKDALIEKLHNYGIKKAVYENMIWYDFCKIIEADDRASDDIDKTYKTCSVMCAGLVKTWFSKCFPALMLTLLRAVPPDAYGEASVIDLTKATRDDLERHLRSDIPLQACTVCSGKNRLAKQIPPARQVNGQMNYKKYY